MATELVTILGELSFPEQISEVAQFALQGKQGPDADQKRNAFIEKANEAADDATKHAALIKEVVNAVGPQNDSNDRELEGVFNLITNLIVTEIPDAEATPLLQHLSKALDIESGSSASDKTIVRYRILSNIFNSLPASSPNRCLVFQALLDLTKANDDFEIVSHALTLVPSWLAEWDVSASTKAALLSRIATDLEAAGLAKRSFDFVLIHLRFLGTATMSGEGSAAASTKEAAERTVASALSLPSIFDFEELAEIEAVKRLEKEPIGKLLAIFLQGRYQDWVQWRDANAGEVTRLKLSAAHLEHKIRLLDLANLCSQSVSRTVPYADIAKALDVDIDEVEVWVIDVIRAGLVSGKLSQINQSLRVYKSAYRTFGQEQWQLLETRLSTWEKSIASILQTLSDARQNNAGNVPRDFGIPGADSATAKQQQNQITA